MVQVEGRVGVGTTTTGLAVAAGLVGALVGCGWAAVGWGGWVLAGCCPAGGVGVTALTPGVTWATAVWVPIWPAGKVDWLGIGNGIPTVAVATVGGMGAGRSQAASSRLPTSTTRIRAIDF